MTKKYFYLFVFCVFSCAHAADQTLYPFTDKNDAVRFQTLTQEIRCVVCQNQNIADSNAPLAKDLREKVYAMVKEQKTDQEIKDYLVARYGEFILLEPRFQRLTWVLWLFPIIGLLGVFLSLRLFLTTQKK